MKNRYKFAVLEVGYYKSSKLQIIAIFIKIRIINKFYKIRKFKRKISKDWNIKIFYKKQFTK